MEFYKAKGQWQKNSLSVFEPIARRENKVQLDEVSVFLIPGRVFDRNGGRLGRGQGFYDKTLSPIGKKQMSVDKEESFSTKAEIAYEKKKALFIGIAFAEQVHEEKIPLLEHDILMDVLVTDRFVLKFLHRKSGIIKKSINIPRKATI